MKALLKWHGKMKFEGQVGGFSVPMDASAPFGDGQHPSPKQVLMTSIAGCTAMDVVGLLKKYRQDFQSFEMEIEGEAQATHPQVFRECTLSYKVSGVVDPAKFNEAIQLSLSKYCSVSAMVSKVIQLKWKSFINDQPQGEGQADFHL
ncbi:MAG: OsmC family protein [Bdellovibrionales bacterium]